MEDFGKLCAFILLYLGGIFLEGLVLMILWNWFVVPIGVKEINFVVALGISVISSMFIPSKQEKRTVKETIDDCGRAIIKSLTILAMGFIVHLFL